MTKQNNILIGVLVIGLVLLLGITLFNYTQYLEVKIEKEEPFIPANYKSPSINSEQAKQYRIEEQQLYNELNYKGVREYFIPVDYGK